MMIRVLACLLLLVSPNLFSQERPRSSFSIKATAIATERSQAGPNGSLQRDAALLSVDYQYQLNPQWGIGISAHRDQLNYRWHTSSEPHFEQIERYGASLSFSYSPGKGTMFMLTPTLQYAYAEDTHHQQAESWGIIANAMQRFGKNKMVGLGVAYLNDIGQVRTMPVLLVSWPLNEQWRIGNPFRAGFSSPAGLELTYQPTPKWQFGIGGSKRTQRFVIDSGEQSTVEVDEWASFIRTGYQLSKSVNLNTHLGYLFDTKLKYNQHPNLRIDPQFAGALTAAVRF